MNKIKISVLIVGIMFICINVIPVSASKLNMTEDAYQKAYEEAYQEYKDDEQFQLMVEAYGAAYGEEFLKDVVENNMMNNLLRGGGGDECYQHVTNIMQTTHNNCGTTTVLQTLYGLNSASSVSGSTDAVKIATLDKEYNIASQGSMIVYQVRDALNKYNKNNQTYTYKEGANMTINDFETYIANSLTYGKPVILHAKTGYFKYYKGKNTGHYLSLDYVHRTNDKVRIVDCNYQPEYFGIHTGISLTEAYNSIHTEKGRYLIY